MKKIEITDENYQMYQNFIDVKSGFFLKNHSFLWSLGLSLLSFGVLIGTVVGAVLIGMGALEFIKQLNNILLWTVFSCSGCAVCISGCYLSLHAAISLVLEIIPMKMFQRKYPNFDIKLEKEKVEEALKEYERPLNLPTEMDVEKEEHLSNLTEQFRQMTTEEKLEYLNRERAFWEQVALQEKYQETGEDRTGQIGIEQGQSSAEKTYHI